MVQHACDQCDNDKKWPNWLPCNKWVPSDGQAQQEKEKHGKSFMQERAPKTRRDLKSILLCSSLPRRPQRPPVLPHPVPARGGEILLYTHTHTHRHAPTPKSVCTLSYLAAWA